MSRSKRDVVRTAFYCSMAGALALLLVPFGAKPAAAQDNARSINGHTVSGRFLQVWSSRGSDQADVYVNGLPITDKRAEVSMTDGMTYDVQWFERARYEAHPGNKAPYDVLLGLLGVTLTEGRGTVDPSTKQARDPGDQAFIKISRPADADGKGKVWFEETGHSISGKILEYWNKYGGLQQFGFPLSEQFLELSPTDGKQYTVQYFERNRFELHPEKQAPYEVELGLLGVQQYQIQPVAGDRLPVAPPAGVKSSKDTLVFGMTTEPANLIAQYSGGNTGRIIEQMIFNGTVNRDNKEKLWPGDIYYVPTVENGGAYFVGQGGDRHLVVKEKIRFGLHWSDGVAMTSADWVYTYKLENDPKSNLGVSVKLSGVDNPDANTVIYNFLSYNQAVALYNKPDQDKSSLADLKPYIDNKFPVTDVLYSEIDGGPPLPEHLVSKLPVDKIPDSDFARNPVGDGPFKVDRWDAGKQIVLVPNPYYSLTAPPLLKRVVVKFISDNDQMISQVKSGDLDAVPYADLGSLGAPTYQTSNALGAAGLAVVYTPQHVYEHGDFNLDKPQFKEKAVRQAIVTGVNRQQIIDKLLGGKATILNTFMPPKTWASMDNPDFAAVWGAKYPINKYAYDPAKANAMLDNAGWVKGPDGIRAKNGVKLAFDYATTEGNADRKQVSQMVAADLQNLGMQVNLKYIPASTLFGDEGTLQKRQFDMAEYAWISGDEPTNPMYVSSDIPSPDNNYSGDNHPGFSNARYDQLSVMADLELERSKRAPLLAQLEQIWNDELPEIPLFSRSNAAVHKNNLVNWFDSGDNYIHTPTYTIAAMYFK